MGKGKPGLASRGSAAAPNTCEGLEHPQLCITHGPDQILYLLLLVPRLPMSGCRAAEIAEERFRKQQRAQQQQHGGSSSEQTSGSGSGKQEMQETGMVEVRGHCCAWGASSSCEQKGMHKGVHAGLYQW